LITRSAGAVELWAPAAAAAERRNTPTTAGTGVSRETEGLIKRLSPEQTSKRNATIVACNYAKTPQIVSSEESDWVSAAYDSTGYRYRWHLY
jgi:hypothetical protein